MLSLELAIAATNIKVINPLGTVAVCSLWTPPEYLFKCWEDLCPELLAKDSPLALIGSLYGGGLKIMLRNLYYNPQIDTVIICGKDFSGAGEHLNNFFQGKITISDQTQTYIFEDGHSEDLEKLIIKGQNSSYSMDALIQPVSFKFPPQILNWTLSSPKGTHPAEKFLSSYQAKKNTELQRPNPIPLPRPDIRCFPSEKFGQAIIADTILEAWPEVLTRLIRFGQKVIFRNGKERHELSNLKVLIKKPGHYDPVDLPRFNLSQDAITAYQNDLINPEMNDHGLSYTYGHRIGKHFGLNLLEKVAQDLAQNLDSRHNYVSLWDNQKDSNGSAPCLVSLFFRKIKEQIHLTALFRSHNGAQAWPVNAFGLYKLMEHVTSKANQNLEKTEKETLIPGSLTIISHSISVDPIAMAQISSVTENYKSRPYKMLMDPNGYFKLGIDPTTKELVALHYEDSGELLTEYRAKTPEIMSQKLTRANALSDLSHALYLGSQLEKAYICLTTGKPFVQDKSKP